LLNIIIITIIVINIGKLVFDEVGCCNSTCHEAMNMKKHKHCNWLYVECVCE
jgi:hypothetical protein